MYRVFLIINYHDEGSMVEIVAFSINRIIFNKDDDADRIVIGSIIIPKKKNKVGKYLYTWQVPFRVVYTGRTHYKIA